MRFYFYRTPRLLKNIYRPCTWQRPDSERRIYLTFDDGPLPVATPYVLDILNEHNAKGTFFVVGDNVKKYPSILASVIDAGNAVGNHTHNHLKGWNTIDNTYFENIKECQQWIDSLGYSRHEKPLFRPPYGRIKLSQLATLAEKYEVIMWEILSGDFDSNLNIESSWEALKKTKAGDIVVFHDSQKYLENVKLLLPKFLEHFSGLGYTFAAL